jgi:hypothetical protein
MKNKLAFLVIIALASNLFLVETCTAKDKTKANKAKTTTTKSETKATPPSSSEPVTYQNKSRHFSFTMPTGWEKQMGEVDSDSVLFMAQPLTKTCSFQININRMQKDFPAEASVAASLDSVTKDIEIEKNISAKRRDESGMENGQKVQFTRGWELTEKGEKGGHQRIIYQAYDRENYYLNMMGAAETEHFEECRPDLQKIIDSIKFGD